MVIILAHHIKTKNRLAKEKKRTSRESIFLLLPLLLIATILPLFVKVYGYSPTITKYDWFAENFELNDCFLYYKQWFFVVLCSILVLVLIGQAIYCKEKFKFSKMLLPLFVYAFFVLASTLFSKDLVIGLTGNYEQFENIFCLLGYILVVYYCFQVIRNENELTMLMNVIAIGAFIIGIIGTFQAFGLDIFNSELVRHIISGSTDNSFRINFEPGRVYITMYNPNYVGVYTSFIIPIFTVLLIFSKKLLQFILYSFVVITSMISLIGSQSKAGFISIIITLIVAFVLLRREILKRWMIILPIIALGIISFFTMNRINNNSYLNALLNTFSNSNSQETSQPVLSSIDTGKDYVEIKYKDNIFRASMSDSGDLILRDNTNNTIPYDIIEQNSDVYILGIDDSRYTEIIPVVYFNDIVEFSFLIDETLWAFHYDYETQQYLYYNRYGRFSPIITPETSLFTGHESFASNRGYIWSRTIPLLKHYLILGSGADTFAQSFTQYDFVGFHNFNYKTSLITKPHSLYLQIGVQTGVISLLAFIVFFLLYLVQSARLYFNHSYNNKASQIGIAVCMGVIAFLISSLTNDSSIAVTPVFWLIVGIGFAANHLVRSLVSKDTK